jgi:gamma-glutamyltranspeptidase/glutathione hydrolase
MKSPLSRTILSLVCLAGAVTALAAAPPSELGRSGMVASDHRRASVAGRGVLEVGGNAVDAAVATALASGVVQPAGSGLGGGGFAVVVLPDGKQTVLDFREVAPKRAHRDMYVESDDDNASRIGGLANAVPGEARGLETLHKRFGKLPWSEVVAPALALARDGFEVEHHLAKALLGLQEDGLTLSRALFDGSAVPRQGDGVTRSELAVTLGRLAREGADVLHEGEGAVAIARASRAAGGILTVDDLAAYTPKDRAPIVGMYRGWTVITMPPPSSGGVVIVQMLGVLEGYDLTSLGHNSADLVHLVSEASKHAFADRARLMGDPDRVDVPVDELISTERIQAVQRAILPGRTFAPEYYGLPVDPGTDGGTLHLSTLDADGMAVALTTTINTSFGSRVTVPGWGMVLNNEMDDFVARPGVPNAYGLVGSEANAVAPGARPLSSMSPTVLISPDGAQRIVVGASGGPFIITSTLQAIVNIIDFGMEPSAASRHRAFTISGSLSGCFWMKASPAIPSERWKRGGTPPHRWASSARYR